MGKTIVKEVTPHLRQGEENAVPARELSKILDLSPRVLRKAIERERLHGRLILSSDAGYFLPDGGTKGLEELRRFVRRSDARLRTNRACVRSAQRRVKELERADSAQITIEDLTE